MRHFKKFKEIWKNKIATQVVGGVESANIGVIFLLALLKALEGVGAFITLPIAMGASAVNSILSIRHAYLKRKEGKKTKGAVLNAVVTTSVSALVITAIILTFVAAGVVAPALLCGALGLKSLYELGESIWCIYKHIKLRHSDPLKAKKYAHKALEHAISFIIEAGAAAAVALVLIAEKSSFGALGAVLGAVGGAIAIYGGVKLYQKYKSKLKKEAQVQIEEIIEQHPDVEHELTNNALLHAKIGTALSQVLEEQGIDLNASTPVGNEQIALSNPQPVYQQVLQPMNQPLPLLAPPQPTYTSFRR